METNRHHFMYERRKHAATRITKLLRGHSGMIRVLPIPVHNEVHANVPPPIVPHAQLARAALDHLNSHGTAEDAHSFFERIAEQGGRHAEQASLLAGNIGLQLAVIDESIKYY